MIEFRSVTKTFRRHAVLRGVDLQIKRGDRVALVGSNGAGKTTMIRCLLGEYTCDGDVLVEGESPRQKRTDILAHVGFVPQLPPPLKMPVGQLMRFASGVCNADPAEMEAVAERLGLELAQVRHQPFVKLSGGQKQKILISVALGRNTDLLVMDEPAANLDPHARHIFFELLAEKQEHSVMLISSHRLDEVASLVNRVIELDQGVIVLDDHVADVVELTSRLRCRIALSRKEEAFAKAIVPWGFTSGDDGLVWEGEVPGPDRLRLLGVLSRYAGLLSSIAVDEMEAAQEAIV